MIKMADHRSPLENRADNIRKIWESVVEDVKNETVEQQVQQTAAWILDAQKMDRTALDPYLIARHTQQQIADVGVRRVEALRGVGKFSQANEALRLTQEYLELLVALEQHAADNALPGEELCARMKRCAQEHLFSLPAEA